MMIEPIYRRLGARLRKARQERGITQQELADRIGLCRVSVVQIEAGKQRIALHHAIHALRVLRVTITELF